MSNQQTQFVRSTQSGLLIPQSSQNRPVGVQCGFCPEIIFKHKEAGGRLFMHRGTTPICARCRILKGSRFAKVIMKDRKLYEKDKDLKEKMAEDNEIIRVAGIAVESQKRASGDSESKKNLKRKLLSK